MAVTAQMVKELRERTGVGMSDCKNALVEANGDMEAAIELLRKKGLAKAAKRAGNETNEGKIKIETDGNTAYVAVVTCETDFVARNETFDGMLTHFIDLRKAASSDEEAIAKAEELKASEYTLKVGENMVIKTLSKIIEGKMKKFREENALLTQSFVVNPDQTVGDFIGNDSIVAFYRYAI